MTDWDELRESALDHELRFRAEVVEQLDLARIDAGEVIWRRSPGGRLHSVIVRDRLGEDVDLDGIEFSDRHGRRSRKAEDWLLEEREDFVAARSFDEYVELLAGVDVTRISLYGRYAQQDALPGL